MGYSPGSMVVSISPPSFSVEAGTGYNDAEVPAYRRLHVLSRSHSEREQLSSPACHCPTRGHRIAWVWKLIFSHLIFTLGRTRLAAAKLPRISCTSPGGF